MFNGIMASGWRWMLVCIDGILRCTAATGLVDGGSKLFYRNKMNFIIQTFLGIILVTIEGQIP